MTIKELYEKYGDVELTEEQEKCIKECLNIKENKKWRPQKEEEYFYINSFGNIYSDTIYSDKDYNDFRLDNNNCFKTKEEAEFILEQIKVYNELKNFAYENNDEIDWENTNKRKYFITLDRCTNLLLCDGCYSTQFIGQIYFSSEELTKRAIVAVGANRIKKYLLGVK